MMSYETSKQGEGKHGTTINQRHSERGPAAGKAGKANHHPLACAFLHHFAGRHHRFYGVEITMQFIWCEKETRRMASGVCEALTKGVLWLK